MQYYVKDFREDSLSVPQGPFSKDEAVKYAEQLNRFVAESGPLAWLARLSEIEGPFYPIPETGLSLKERAEIERLLKV